MLNHFLNFVVFEKILKLKKKLYNMLLNKLPHNFKIAFSFK